MLATDEFLDNLMDATLDEAWPHYVDAVVAQIFGGEDEIYWKRFEAVMVRSIALGYLVGIAGVYQEAGIEFEESSPMPQLLEYFADAPKKPKASVIRASIAGFVVGPFKEAILAMQSRIPRFWLTVSTVLTKSIDFTRSLVERERQVAAARIVPRIANAVIVQKTERPFFVTGLSLEDTAKVKEEVVRVMKSVTSPQPISTSKFIDTTQARISANLTSARLQTVVRNNTSAAYNDARIDAASEPEVRRAMPLAEIDEMRDRRTRGNPIGLYPHQGKHFQMSGYVNTVDGFARQGIRFPAGHNCRGSFRLISAAEAMRRGFLDEDGRILEEAVRQHNGERQRIIDRGEYPDPGFKAA